MTFGRKLAIGIAIVVLFAIAITAIAIYALRQTVTAKDHVIDVNAAALVRAGDLKSDSFRLSSQDRGYWLTGNPKYLQMADTSRADFHQAISDLQRLVETDEGRQFVAEIQRAYDEYDAVVRSLDEMRSRGATADAIGQRMSADATPKRAALENTIQQFSELENRRLVEGRTAASGLASNAQKQVTAIAIVLVIAAGALAIWLIRSLTTEVSAAVRDIQTSAAELQTTSTEQATGAREQATAMSEITTTMSELLATSKQIAESAQRVSGISSEAADAAQAGDRVVRRASDTVAGIKHQVDTVVTYMLDLGRKSQQIGGIVDVVNELAEQTNILAINASIEAAGAGDAGKRFGVVADEIRKLADRVGGSIKDIRGLIEEVRSAVNTTVMATETGSKAVDAGTRDFAEVTHSLGQIVSLVGTNFEAAREIELSTKQQATAVEQVNSAVANVAQVSREVENSTLQASQTASQLATLSRRLAQLVSPDSVA